MHTIHLCYAWYGVVNPITMACTIRTINAAHTMGYTLCAHGHCS